MSRYARRTDVNQAEIVEALREEGFHVQVMSAAGFGWPDLLVWKGDWWRMVEVKGPRGQLTEAEQLIAEVCADRYVLARTIEDVLEAWRATLSGR